LSIQQGICTGWVGNATWIDTGALRAASAIAAAAEDGKWRPAVTEIRTLYRLFCSEEDGHGTSADDDGGMKFYRKLPDSLDLSGIGEPCSAPLRAPAAGT
jgi:hypothetical protein